MTRKARRFRHKSILMVLEKHKLQRLRFKEIRQGLKDIGHRTDDATITSNLKYLIKKGSVTKFKGNLYCLTDWAGTIATNEFLNLLYDLRDRYPVGSKKWVIEHCILYRFLKGIGQTKILSKQERKVGEDADKLGLLNEEGIKKMRMEAETIEQENIDRKN